MAGWINPATNQWDDNWHAQQEALSRGGGGGGGGITGDFINSILGYAPSKVKPYDEVNPFSFDEKLAREASTAEYSPYYNEMLSDYVTGVERTKSRSQEDLSKTLDQLQGGKEYYMGTQRRALDKATKSVNEGYAGRGLFFSGVKGKDLADLQTEYGAQTNEFDRQYQYDTGQAKTNALRTGENIDLARSQYERDTNREKQLGIEQGVLQRKTEAQNEYEMGRTKYYDQAGYKYS